MSKNTKKDDLATAMANLSKPTPKPFTGIKPMSLDDMPTKDEQANAQNEGGNSRGTVDNTAISEAKPPRKNVKATLTKRQWGKKQTKRYSFEITPELKAKLDKRTAEIQLTTGKKISASEIIRDALARYLREL